MCLFFLLLTFLPLFSPAKAERERAIRSEADAGAAVSDLEVMLSSMRSTANSLKAANDSLKQKLLESNHDVEAAKMVKQKKKILSVFVHSFSFFLLVS